MKFKPIHAYVGVVCALALASQTLLPWSDILQLSNRELAGLSALILLGFLSEFSALSVRFGLKTGQSSIFFLPLLACAIVFGPVPAVILSGLTSLVAERVVRQKLPVRAYFNVGQYVFATTLAGFVFQAWGGLPQVQAHSDHFEFQLLPPLMFGLTFLVVNHVAVGAAIAIDERQPVHKIVLSMAGSAGSNLFYDLLVLPIALAVAFLYVELYITGIVLVILPLLFIRYAYLNNYQLQQANRDLLKALVKAIETRDPYTSGHSMRVAALATRIGEGLHLSKRRVEAVETAAMLHDIGKIEGVYAEILAKPASLSPEEREIIESHVTKGVELLESLASYPRAILDGVRHHHERIDGAGYPDGLKGEAIPLIARIINACDAIDAMLSDRPYRSALKIDEVHAELVKCAGKHFDVGVVAVVVGSDILERHAETVRESVAEAGDQFVVEPVAEPVEEFVVKPVAEPTPRWATRTARAQSRPRPAGD